MHTQEVLETHDVDYRKGIMQLPPVDAHYIVTFKAYAECECGNIIMNVGHIRFEIRIVCTSTQYEADDAKTQ